MPRETVAITPALLVESRRADKTPFCRNSSSRARIEGFYKTGSSSALLLWSEIDVRPAARASSLELTRDFLAEDDPAEPVVWA